MLQLLCRPAEESSHLLLCLHRHSFVSGNSLKLAYAAFRASFVALKVNYHSPSRIRSSDPLITVNKFLQCKDTRLRLLQCTFLESIPRRLNHDGRTKSLLEEVKNKEYISLYLVKSISMLRIMCTAAKVSMAMFGAGLPFCIGALLFEVMTQNTAIYITSTLAFYALFLTGQSYLFFSRIVGKIMISSDHSYMKFSRLTLFGTRRDMYVKTSDIAPLVKSGSIFDKRILRIRLSENSKQLIFLPQFGGDDTNFDALEMIFGAAPKQTK